MAKIVNDIDKLSWNMIQHVKDVVSKALSDATAKGELKIERSVLTKLVAIASASVEQGYHESSKNFLKSVTNAVEEHNQLTLEQQKSDAKKKDSSSVIAKVKRLIGV